MYGTEFYDLIRPGVISSAEVVVPLVWEALHPKTVIDVGCGEGWWAYTFHERCGCEVIGVDGSYVDRSPLTDRFVPHDLLQPLPAHLAARFDLAVCLEVAEHLPAWRADTFVAELVALAPVVLFSAAIPGQGGVGHINEQWPDYWVEKFRRHGYLASGALRWKIWDDPRVENWYAQNLLLFTGSPGLAPELFRGPQATPYPVVHPVLYNARRGA